MTNVSDPQLEVGDWVRWETTDGRWATGELTCLHRCDVPRETVYSIKISEARGIWVGHETRETFNVGTWDGATVRRVPRSLINDEIIDVRAALLAKSHTSTLSVHDQELFRDCNRALGVKRCTPEEREAARARILQAVTVP